MLAAPISAASTTTTRCTWRRAAPIRRSMPSSRRRSSTRVSSVRGDAEHRDDDGDQLQRVGDGEGAVEDAQHLGAQRAIGVDEDPPPVVAGRRGSAARTAIGVGARRAGRRARLVGGQVAEVLHEGAAVHHHHAAIGGVVVVDALDRGTADRPTASAAAPCRRARRRNGWRRPRRPPPHRCRSPAPAPRRHRPAP